MRLHVRTLLLSLLIPAAATAMAGTVEVSLVNPGSFGDAGSTQWDKEANLRVLAKHLQSLGQRWLPANQVLKVELLDVDLAGNLRRGASDLRIQRGRADFPRIHLRYTLQVDGAPARSGDEWLSDPNYTLGLPELPDSDALYYEKRMLQAWFKDRFVNGRTANG